MNEKKATRSFAPAGSRRAGKLASAAILLFSVASLTYAIPPTPCIATPPEPIGHPHNMSGTEALLRAVRTIWRALPSV